MTIRYAAGAPDFNPQLRRLLNAANGQPHSMDIAAGLLPLVRL